MRLLLSRVGAVAGCRPKRNGIVLLRARQSPQAERDNFDFVAWNPTPVATRDGELSQLAGNGWEWTSVPFEGFPGFQAVCALPRLLGGFF